jgi:hypothetical protein
MSSTDTDTVKEIKTFDVYKDDGKSNLKFVGKVRTTNYSPNATELGEQFGDGSFLVRQLDADDKLANYGNFITVESQTYYSQKWD